MAQIASGRRRKTVFDFRLACDCCLATIGLTMMNLAAWLVCSLVNIKERE
jgi:hypothetical protein